MELPLAVLLRNLNPHQIQMELPQFLLDIIVRFAKMEICALLSLDPRTFLRPYRSCPLALRHLPTPSHYFIRTRCCTSLLRCNPEHIIPRVNIMEPEVSVVESPVEQTPPAKGKKVRLACQRCRDRRIKVCGDESPYKPPCCLLT